MRAAMAGVELSTPVRIKASSTATTTAPSSGKKRDFTDTQAYAPGSGRKGVDGTVESDSWCDLSSAGSVRAYALHQFSVHVQDELG